MSLGQVIKEQRKLNNLTQEQLANLLSVSPQAVSRWENNMAMPDISQLIPLASIFQITTDELLEVDIKSNENHIKDVIKRRFDYGKPGHLSFEEKLYELRQEVRNHPTSIELKDTLLSALIGYAREKPAAEIDSSIWNEIISLAQDILDSGKGTYNRTTYQEIILVAADKIKHTDTLAELAKEARTMDLSSEVLRPLSLTGKEQATARLNLIFCCINHAICTLYDLMRDNATTLTDAQWNELKRAESLISVVYGQQFSECFTNMEQLYKGVIGAKSRSDLSEVKSRLQKIVQFFSIRANTGTVFSSIMMEDDFLLVEGDLFLHDIDEDAVRILEHLFNDFSDEVLSDLFLEEVTALATYLEEKTSKLRIQVLEKKQGISDENNKEVFRFINQIRKSREGSEEYRTVVSRKKTLLQRIKRLKTEK